LDEEEAMAWQDVLDEIAAGRPGNISCPFCGATPLQVEDTEGRTRVSCQKCGKFIEGRFRGY
jgi:transcription elongation factor Elf1